jgi:hypothetical protein
MLNYNYTFDGNNTDSSTILLFLIHFNFVSRFDRVKYVFGIVVAFIVVVWKKLFYKKYFWLGWFDIYICLVKTVVEIEVEQKVV